MSHFLLVLPVTGFAPNSSTAIHHGRNGCVGGGSIPGTAPVVKVGNELDLSVEQYMDIDDARNKTIILENCSLDTWIFWILGF